MYSMVPIETPAPPPPPAPPAPRPAEVAAAPVVPALEKSETPGQIHISLSRQFCEIVVLAAVPLLLILSFFRWDGAYPAGYPAYTQNAWQALGGGMSVDPVAEKELGLEKALSGKLRSSWWMLPYLMFLLVTLIVAWVGIAQRIKSLKLPGILLRALKYRPALLMAGAGLMMLFLLLQMSIGFGITNALELMVEERFQEERAQARTPEEIQRVEMKMGGELGSFGIRATIWLRIALALHVLLVLAVVGEAILTHRGNRPPPQLIVRW